MDNILQAIEEFLKSMKLTLQDMKQRPALSAAVVGYHGEDLGWWGWLGPWHTPRQLEVEWIAVPQLRDAQRQLTLCEQHMSLA